jgi:hypothetical protein
VSLGWGLLDHAEAIFSYRKCSGPIKFLMYDARHGSHHCRSDLPTADLPLGLQ